MILKPSFKPSLRYAARWIGLTLPSIAFFAILLSSRVLAQDCLLIGPLISCDDGTSGQRIGNTTYWNDGTSSERIGRSTFNSDGTSSQTIGNNTYYLQRRHLVASHRQHDLFQRWTVVPTHRTPDHLQLTYCFASAASRSSVSVRDAVIAS